VLTGHGRLKRRGYVDKALAGVIRRRKRRDWR